MLSTILIPLDGSQFAERAVAYADRLAEATSARLVLIQVLPLRLLERPETDLDIADEARAYLRGIADQLTSKGRVVETATPWNDPSSGILDQVRASQAELVVMATHGRSGPGRWVYGSVADEVLRAAPVPVVLVPARATRPWAAGARPRILVPLDGSELGEAALAPTEKLATRIGAEVVLLQVVQWPPYTLYGDGAYVMALDVDQSLTEAQQYIGAVAKRLSVSHVRCVVELGDLPAAIAEIARREKADLIAMATHGRSGLARLVLGSVATGTLQQASIPLMLVRPTELEVETAPASVEAERALQATV